MAMPDFLTVARVGDVAPGTGILVEAGERRIALFNVDGTFFAVDDVCPHAGGPLSEGYLADRTVTCPWHAWTFDLESGECLTYPSEHATKYEVRVVGEEIQVAL
jgi:nitrite reductase (NADH) small subunit